MGSLEERFIIQSGAYDVIFDCVSHFEGKKKEPVIFSVSGEEKFPIRETIENDVIGPEFVVVQLYVFRLYNLDFQK